MRSTGSSSGWAAIAARAAARSTSCCSTRPATPARPSRSATPPRCWATPRRSDIDDVVGATFDGELIDARPRARPRVRRGRQSGAAGARPAAPRRPAPSRVGPCAKGGNLEAAMFKARGLPRGGPVRRRFESHLRAWPLPRLSHALTAHPRGRDSNARATGLPDEAIARRLCLALAKRRGAIKGRVSGAMRFLPPPDGERDRRLLGQDQEGEALLDVEPHPLGIVLEIADREILADRQLEVAAALGDHQAAVEAGRPDDVAVDQALDVAEDRIAARRCARRGPCRAARSAPRRTGPRRPRRAAW